MEFDAVTNAAPVSAVLDISTAGTFNFSYDGVYGQNQVDAEAALAAGNPIRYTNTIKPGLCLEWTNDASPDANTDWKQVHTLQDNGEAVLVDLQVGKVRVRAAGETDAGTNMTGSLD